MIDWELSIQQQDGAFPGHFGEAGSQPVIFNTGQIMHGMLAGYLQLGRKECLEAAVKAGWWLLRQQDTDGSWRKFEHNGVPHVYNTRGTWALTAAGLIANEQELTQAARRNLNWALTQQTQSGWFATNAFTPDKAPFTHTIAYYEMAYNLAEMEEDLDEIAGGDKEQVPYLSNFYFGNGHPGLVELVSSALDKGDAREINTIPFDDSDDIVLRTGKFGPYLQRGEERASVPEDLPPDELTLAKAIELLDAPSTDRTLGTDPETGKDVIARSGRFGPYIQLGSADDTDAKPATASLFKSMALDTVTLEDALRLLALPRTVGEDPQSGEEITAQNGRYGPYLKRGKDTRSIESEAQIFTIDLAEALALFAQPKRRRGQKAAAALRELGVDPVTGCGVAVRDGRFGPYVKHGKVYASLEDGDDVLTIGLNRAVTLIAEKIANPKTARTIYSS